MAAMKEYAIELESNQLEAGELRSSTRAYRMGMLEAARLITESQKYFTECRPDAPAWLALHETWSSVIDAIDYLREVDRNS